MYITAEEMVGVVGGQSSKQWPGGSSFGGASLSSSAEARGGSGILNGEAVADILAVLMASSLSQTHINKQDERLHFDYRCQ